MSEAATKIADAYDVHCGDPMRPEWRTELVEKIDAAIAAAVRQEREACARLCNDPNLGQGFQGGGISDLDDLDSKTRRACASAILSRSNKETPDAKA